MHRVRRPPIRRLTLALGFLGLACGACSGGDELTAGAGDDHEEADHADGDASGGLSSDSDALPNACPVEGCKIFITSAEASGDEIKLVFDANFTPDFERNHIHVFWDSQDPGAVGSDFQDEGFSEQGRWHPTDEYPEYVTQADASVASEFRAGSTTICVTAGDTDHAVIDPGLTACRDVADLVS